MASESVWTRLRTQWEFFIGLIMEPITFLFAGALGTLYWYSTTAEGRESPLLIYVLLTIAAAILGGRVTKKWVDMNEGSVVAARGHSAVRSLKLQLRSVVALESTFRQYREAEEEIENEPNVVKRNYEEAIRTCVSLQEQTVSAIENWTDIVPEADIKSQIGMISELKSAIKDKEKDLEQLKKALEDAKGKSEKEKQALKKRISESELQISELQQEAWGAKYSLGGLSSAAHLAMPDLSHLHIDTPRLGDLLANRISEIGGMKLPGLLSSKAKADDDDEQ